MERIKGANGELMKYSMQPMDGKGHLTLYRYDQLAVGGADNAHLEFWIEIEELRKQLADAQATIAALHARVQELEESRDAWKASQECSEKAYMALVNQIPAERFDYDPINVALLDGAKEQEIIGRKQIADLQSQLTQRTAELEAANKLLYRKNCALGRAETIINDLQAELERVRADNKALDEWRADVTVSLQRPGGAFFVDVPQHIKDLVKERDDLRTLILALPKVEGEIEVKLYGDEFVVMIMGLIWLKCYKTDEVLINAIVALWQHRHGMEG